MRKISSLIYLSLLLMISGMSFADAPKEMYDGNYSCDTWSGYLAIVTRDGRIEADLTDKVRSAQVALKNGIVSVTALIDGTPMAYRLYMNGPLNMGKERWSFHIKNDTDPHFLHGYVIDGAPTSSKSKAKFTVSFENEYFETHKQLTTHIGITIICGTK